MRKEIICNNLRPAQVNMGICRPTRECETVRTKNKSFTITPGEECEGNAFGSVYLYVCPDA